jgi:hypothetical protein
MSVDKLTELAHYVDRALGACPRIDDLDDKQYADIFMKCYGMPVKRGFSIIHTDVDAVHGQGGLPVSQSTDTLS